MLAATYISQEGLQRPGALGPKEPRIVSCSVNFVMFQDILHIIIRDKAIGLRPSRDILLSPACV